MYLLSYNPNRQGKKYTLILSAHSKINSSDQRVTDRQVNPAAVVIHTSSKTSKHVKMCKLTNTRLPPSGKLWLSGCTWVCICEGTCMYDYSSGNNNPTGVNEAGDWRSSLPVSTENGRQSGWELSVWESPGEERERAGSQRWWEMSNAAPEDELD